MNSRRTALIAAILLALATGWLTLNYVNGLKRANLGERRNVVVAAVDIPARATITANMLQQVQLPAGAVEPDALSDPARAVGQLTLITIPAGAEISASKIGSPALTSLPIEVKPGKRAVSIAVDKVRGVSGLLQPGDRVDVIAIPPKDGNQVPPAETILRGILVLAVGQTLESVSATPSPDEENSTTVTLELNPSQADLLAMADQNTTLRLALRSPREPINSEPTEALRFGGDVPQAVAAAPSQPAPAAAYVPVHRPAPSRDGGIMMIVGDRVSYGVDATSAGSGQEDTP